MGWTGSTTTEYWSTILRRMPFLTQTRLKISLNEDPVLEGSLAFGASTNSQGSESKRLLIRQYNDRLYTPLTSAVRRPSFNSATWSRLQLWRMQHYASVVGSKFVISPVCRPIITVGIYFLASYGSQHDCLRTTIVWAQLSYMFSELADTWIFFPRATGFMLLNTDTVYNVFFAAILNEPWLLLLLLIVIQSQLGDAPRSLLFASLPSTPSVGR